MGILAHIVEHDRALAGIQSLCGATGDERLFSEANHGAKGEFQ